MSILIDSKWFAMFAVLWPVYDIRNDKTTARCFRARVGKWHIGGWHFKAKRA